MNEAVYVKALNLFGTVHGYDDASARLAFDGQTVKTREGWIALANVLLMDEMKTEAIKQAYRIKIDALWHALDAVSKALEALGGIANSLQASAPVSEGEIKSVRELVQVADSMGREAIRLYSA